MKFLFITNTLYPNLNANSAIVYQLAAQLQKKGNDITVLGYRCADDEKHPFLREVEVSSISKTYQIVKKYRKVHKYLYLFFRPFSMRYFLRSQQKSPKAEQIEYEHTLRSLLKRESFDAIVGFTCPVYIANALLDVAPNIPVILYKLDPWHTNYQLTGNQNAASEELQADNLAAAIITTPIGREEYIAENNPNLKKVHALEFPNIVRRENNENKMKFSPGDQIHCVFTGGLYKDIRNPEYTFRLFERIKNSGIVLHVFGYLAERDFQLNQLPSNVIYHGAVPPEEASAYMQAADILVNIGNTVTNQIPSKIFNYISAGKPVLNIIKNENCLTLRYLEKYPLGISILENNEMLEESSERAKDFILSNRGKTVPFETVEGIYRECTPEYVADRFCDIICNAIEKNNNRSK